jgi:hypothetical protein
MELHDIEAHLADHLQHPRGCFIDEQADRRNPRRQTAAQPHGFGRVDRPRTARIEDKADSVGAKTGRSIDISGAHEAAELDAGARA